jgi:hypothetical protein
VCLKKGALDKALKKFVEPAIYAESIFGKTDYNPRIIYRQVHSNA